MTLLTVIWWPISIKNTLTNQKHKKKTKHHSKFNNRAALAHNRKGRSALSQTDTLFNKHVMFNKDLPFCILSLYWCVEFVVFLLLHFLICCYIFGLFICYATAVFKQAKSSIRFHNPFIPLLLIYSLISYQGWGKCVLSGASAEPVEVVSGFTLSSYFASYSWVDGKGENWDQYSRLHVCGSGLALN